jgi:hypothetical protein
MGREPSALRLGTACIAASAAAAAPTLLLGLLAIYAFPIAFMVAGAHMVLLGMPTYLVLRQYRRIDWLQALIAGFVIGTAPLTLWQLALFAGGAYGYFPIATLLIAGGLGSISGAVFRAIVGSPIDPRSMSEVAAVFD